MKLTIRGTDSNDVRTTKTFDKIGDTVSDAKLTDFAKAYVKLTNAVSNVVTKTTVSELAIA